MQGMDQGGSSEANASGAGNIDAESPENLPKRDITTLLAIMAALRTPVTGCPWDLEQDFNSIIPYTIEEAYEVADAIERGDMAIFARNLATCFCRWPITHKWRANGAFTFDDVVESINTKMVRRHPHVFGDQAARSAGVAKGFWEKHQGRRAQGHQQGAQAPSGWYSACPARLDACAEAAEARRKGWLRLA
jgi:ATP diphosphatase